MNMYNVKNAGGEILNLDGPMSHNDACELAKEIEAEHNIDVSVKELTTQEAVDWDLVGIGSPVEIYWDKQDPQNIGPAYRWIDGSESGSLEFVGWYGDGAEGYTLENYFDGDGRYIGPDRHGIHPIFKA